MASLVLSGDSSGSITVSAPAVAGSTTQTLVNVTGTLAPIVSGTAVTASGTSVDFTGIPSWAKRITVMLSGVSTNGSSNILVQVGAGSFATTGYLGSTSVLTTVVGTSNYTNGLAVATANAAASVVNGLAVICNVSGNVWAMNTATGYSNGAGTMVGASNISLGGVLDRVRITTVNGTDTFDAGTINIIYE